MKGLIHIIGRVAIFGVVAWLAVRWVLMNDYERSYIKNVLRQVLYLPGRYAV